jgi:hypothetical protein
VSGDFQIACDYPVLGRKHVQDSGVWKLTQHLFTHTPVAAGDVDWSRCRLPVLSIDLEPVEADWQLRDDMVDSIAAMIRAKHGLTRYTEFGASFARVENFRIVLYPLWQLVYLYAGAAYRASLEGVQGTILTRTVPTLPYERAARFAAAAGCGALAGALVGAAVMVLTSGTPDRSPPALLGCAGFLAYWAYRQAEKILTSARTEDA